MRLNETQINVLRTSVTERQLEITSVIGEAKSLVRSLEGASDTLTTILERAEFVYDNNLDVSEDRAREAVVIMNSALSGFSGDIDLDNIEAFSVEGQTDVITRLIALGD